MDNKSIKEIKNSLRFLPLSIMMATTGILFQQAHCLRMEMIIEDDDLSSIFQWIHPAACAALILGYGVSMIPIILSFKTNE